MYNVLIVDDEPMIRDGLKTIIPWTSYGFQVVDTAADAVDALKKYKAHQIDLMLMDIRMPGMDGLQLMSEIRNTDTRIHFIILSGYSEFEYAKRAINANVTGYLLKPVDEDELIQYLEIVRTKLQQEKGIELLEKDTLTFQKDHLLQTLIHLNKDEQEAITEESLTLFIDWVKYRLIVMELISKREVENKLLFDMKQRLKEIFEPEKGYVFMYEQKISILLKDHAITEKKLVDLYQKVTEVMIGDHSVCCSISKEFTNIKAINKAYHEVKSLLDRKFFYHENGFIQSDSQPTFQTRKNIEYVNKEFPLHSFAEKLYYAIDIANQMAIKDTLQEAAQVMVDLQFCEEKMKKSFVQLMTAILSKCSATKPELQSEITTITGNIGEIHYQHNIKQLINYLYTSLRKVIENLDIGDQTIQIKKLIDFIHRNYHENLKLEALAELFNYNSAYLGKLFKNYTGQYFNTYLDQVRMENAKTYLTQGLKVYRVAERVGYSNVDYFHHKFKKYVGMSPSKFRKSRVK